MDKPIEFDAVLTIEQVQERERPDDFGVNRRLMLATLTRSSSQLADGFRGADGNELAAMIEAVGEYKVHLKALLELTECAEARILATCQMLLDEDEQGADCHDEAKAVASEVSYD